MILLLAVTVLPPVLIGSLFVRTFLPLFRPAGAGWLLNLSLGTGLGMGLLSLLYFLVRLLVGPSNVLYVAAETAAVAAAAAVCWFFRGRSLSGPEPPYFGGWLWLLPAALVFCLILAAALFVDTSAASPYGNWDAWSIWNLRAKLLAQPAGAWENAFSPLLNQLAGGGATHADYPLLLSGYIARSWRLTASIGDVAIPVAVSGLFSLATAGLLVAGLAALRGWTAALTGGLILLGTAEFLHNSPWQLADVPLGFFYLSVFVLFFLFDATPGAGRMLVVTGLALGCAAWTKDEGMLFAVLAIIGFVVWQALYSPNGRTRTLAQLGAGAALPLAVTVYFKIFLAPKGIWAPLTLSMAAHKMLDVSRYTQIFAALWKETLGLGTGIAHPAVSLAVVAACLGVSRERLRRPGVMIPIGAFLAVSAAYFFTYVVTPLDLAWHLSTSAGRLMVQLLPSLIFVVLAVCRTAEETALTIEEPKKAVRARQKKLKRAQTARQAARS